MAAKYKYFLVALLVSLALDQGTKMWARKDLQPMRPASKVIINGYFDLRYSENTGAAFGMFRDMTNRRVFLLGVGAIALVMVGAFLRKVEPNQWRLGAELGLLAGGALGNIIDRFAYGKVTDFIVWKIGTHEWPTFNIADAALVVGVIGYFFDMKPPAEPKQTS